MVSHEGMGRITVAQADACRRFEYMEVVRRSDWAYLGCYDALVVWPVPPMEGDGTSAQTMFGLADLDVVSSLNGVCGSRAAIVDIDWIDMRDWWFYLVNLLPYLWPLPASTNSYTEAVRRWTMISP